MVRAVIFVTLLLLASLGVNASTFPRPPALEPAVSFWVKVYTQIPTQQGFIFRKVTLASPTSFDVVTLRDYISASALARAG